MQTRQFPWEYQMDAKDCGPLANVLKRRENKNR